jgi:fluoride exporter
VKDVVCVVYGSCGSSAAGLLAVNSVGSFVAGFFGAMSQGTPWVAAAFIGFCGCLTTFSGLALESVRLIEQGEIFKMGVQMLLHNAMCLLLCY